jgi:hypothetical protein
MPTDPIAIDKLRDTYRSKQSIFRGTNFEEHRMIIFTSKPATIQDTYSHDVNGHNNMYVLSVSEAETPSKK